MTKQLQLFKYEHDNRLDDVRTIAIKGEIWFVATDVATVLGYSNSRDAISRHCKEKGVVKRDTPNNRGGTQNMTLINEPNVYRLITKSQLPSAEKFEAWLFEEVIPSIRKTGGYGIDRNESPNFVNRYFENYNRIPRGYFSVITELYVRLYARFEHEGYKIPNKAWDGKEIRPDVSVGSCFAKYLRDNFPSVSDNFKTYKHKYPSGFEVDAKLYPIEIIPIFIKYVDQVWTFERAEEYFSKRDRMALDYLPKLLAAS